MVRGVIVADDLTGAADACATFVARGYSGAVVFDTAADTRDVDVIAISTDTRGLPMTLAIDRVRAAVRQSLAAYPSALLFKKIDSTLRGHVGRELTAAMDISRARLAIVAPAFRAMGRTVEDGVLRVTGATTQKPRHVTAMLDAQGVRACRRIARPRMAPGGDGSDGSRAAGSRDGERVGAGTDGHRDGGRATPIDVVAAWRESMTAAIRHGARVLVCDSLDDADLDAIVLAASAFDASEAGDGARLGGRDEADRRGRASAYDGPVLWVGSAGLADALARLAPRLRETPACREHAHTAQREGADDLRGLGGSGEPPKRHAHADGSDATSGARRPGAPAVPIERLVHHSRPQERGAVAADDARSEGAPVVFWIGSHHPVTVEQRRTLLARPGVAAAGGGATSVARAGQLLARRVHLVLDVGPAVSDDTIAQLAELVVQQPVAGFVMTGGETAARVCRLLEASAIRLAGEVSRGIPHGALVTRSGRRWPVVLKSGGFGTPRALVETLAFLSDRERQHV